LDLSDEDFIGTIKEATQDLDIGVVVSNAGTGNPGSFIKKNRDDLLIDARLSVTAHLELCYHFLTRDEFQKSVLDLVIPV
jgi:uncharacterized protein